jgi:hypothetical protein
MIARRQHPEADLQAQVCKFLALALPRDAWFGAVPLGGGGRLRGATLKRTGSKAGTPDVLIIANGAALWLELKSKRGTVSDAQLYCHNQLRRAGSPVYVVRTLGDAIEALGHHRIPLRAQVAA